MKKVGRPKGSIDKGGKMKTMTNSHPGVDGGRHVMTSGNVDSNGGVAWVERGKEIVGR